MGYQTPKLLKSDLAGKGYLSAIMYLSPWKTSGLGNLCPQATEGCRNSCLFFAGRGRTYSVQQSRNNKTRLFYEDRKGFIKQLREEINAFQVKCLKLNQKAAVRLNGTSDQNWHKLIPGLMDDFPHIQFYDYTKNFKMMWDWCKGNMPGNYHLTFSRSEKNEKECQEILKLNGNVAVVFRTTDFPNKWWGYKCVSGDDDDLRFLNKKRTIIALKAKGKAKKDQTGFVVDL